MSLPDRPEGAISTDERREIARALEEALEHLQHVEDDPYHWKWVIIAFHNGLQGLMAMALAGTDFVAVLRDRDEWYRWFNNNLEGENPPVYMDAFMELYRRLATDDMDHGASSQKWNPSEKHDREICRLNDFRNEFIHFIPQSWIFTGAEVAQMVQVCLDVALFLLHESGNVRIYEKDLSERTSSALEQLRVLTGEYLA